MMYPYMTLEDGTEVVHSELKEKDGRETVLVHFERPSEAGFDSARCELPGYVWTPWEGSFSPEEYSALTRYLEANAHLIYRFARTGGALVA